MSQNILPGLACIAVLGAYVVLEFLLILRAIPRPAIIGGVLREKKRYIAYNIEKYMKI